MAVSMTRRKHLRAPSGPKFGHISRPDAVTVITWFAVLLYVVPTDRRIEALGSAGSPAYILAVVALLWWAWHRIRIDERVRGRTVQWVRIGFFIFAGACVASYAKSAVTALPAAEISVADSGLIRVAALAGILLLANDGITSEERFKVLIRRLTWFAGLYAALGLVQFVTGLSIVDTIQIPGLPGSGDVFIGARSGFVRSAATATHPLEYAVVLTMMLPFCLNVAIYDRSGPAVLRWLPVATVTISAVLSVTRSAFVALAAVIIILFPTWSSAVRRVAVPVMALGAVGLYITVPGMTGTIVGMFTSVDSSVTSRTDSYDEAFSFLAISPLFGRGFGTFLPSYRILDNQYLLTLVDIGVVGLVALFGVIISAIIVVLSARQKDRDQFMIAMRPAFVASMVAGSLSFGLFDAFAFPQACGTLFMVAGLCGAYANLGWASQRYDLS